MRKAVFITLIFILSSNVNAGILSKFLKVSGAVAIGLAITDGLNARQLSLIERRQHYAKFQLWSMHVLEEYEEDYIELVRYIEDTERMDTNVYFSNTIAWVYFDKKEYDKAISIYASKVIPWINGLSEERIDYFKNNYENMKNVESCIILGCSDLIKKAYRESLAKGEKEKLTKDLKKELLVFESSITEKIEITN